MDSTLWFCRQGIILSPRLCLFDSLLSDCDSLILSPKSVIAGLLFRLCQSNSSNLYHDLQTCMKR